MSVALNEVIYQTLTGSADLAAILAVDTTIPDDPAPAVYYSTHDRVASPVYPCITFHEDVEHPDHRFIEPGDDFSLQIYGFEFWTQSEQAGDVTTMMDLIKNLFHNKTDLGILPDTPGPGGATLHNYLYWSELIGTSNKGLWNPQLKGYYGLARYGFRYQTRNVEA